MAFCDKDRLLRFAAGLKTKFITKSDYDPTGAVAKAGGIEAYVRSVLEPTGAVWCDAGVVYMD